LAGSVLSNGDSCVGSGHVQVGLADDAHAEVVKGAGEEAGEGGGEGHRAVTAGHTNTNLYKEECF